MNLPQDASSDQSNCPHGYYRNTSGMVMQIVPQTALAAVKAFVPDMSDDDLRKLAREKLSEALQAIDAVSQPGMTLKLCAEVKDRLDGKAVANIRTDNTLAVLVSNVKADEALLAHIKRELIEGIVIDNQ